MSCPFFLNFFNLYLIEFKSKWFSRLSVCLSEISVSLLSVIVTFCGIVLLSVSLFVSWKLCWLPWRDKEGGGLSLTAGLLPGGAGLHGVAGGSSLLPPLLHRKDTHSSSSLYPSLAQAGQHHPHFSDVMGVDGGGAMMVGGVVGGPQEMQEHSYLDMDSYPNNAGESTPKYQEHNFSIRN